VKRILALALIALAAATGLIAQDFSALDALHDERQFAEELAGLKKLYTAADPQAAVVYRIIRNIQETATQMPKERKNEKLAKYDEAINFGKPLLETSKGSARDRAQVYYWYGVAMGQKGTTMGVLNALFMTGEMKGNCDKAIALDPSFPDPYFLKAKVDDAVPSFAGGDKNRMGVLFAKSIELDPNHITFLSDFAMALKTRNKNAAFNSDGKKGVPAGMSDLDYAAELAKRARAALAALPKPTISQREKIDDLKAAGL